MARDLPTSVGVRSSVGIVGSVVALAITALAALSIDVRTAPVPSSDDLVPAPRLAAPAFDVWGRSVWSDEVASLDADDELLDGAVAVDEALLALGEQTFHTGTFGNEIVLTEIVGLLDGPLRLADFVEAIAALGGRATTSLRVRLGEDAVVGGRSFRAGEPVDTGIDVPAGWASPLGVVLRLRNGRPSVGVTCALCHATVDPRSGRVLTGVPNPDVALGTLLALASNSAAVFPHATPVAAVPADPSRVVIDGSGARVALPDRALFEDAVDRILLAWPPGRFDASIDGVANPTDVPDAFTAADHPYGRRGSAGSGPFRGLADFSGRPHAPVIDLFGLEPEGRAVLGRDPEVVLGIALQGAPSARFRLAPGDERQPSAILAHLDERPEPGARARSGLALAAFQNTLAPPAAFRVEERAEARGRQVFERAGCGRCHGGVALSDHAVVDDVKTPSLIGLAWSAPYLHDGGVAVGSDPLRGVGLVATVMRGVPVDPRESLRALVDRRRRAHVVAANRVAGLDRVQVTGEGHPHWVDVDAGFDRSDQEALVAWLLGYRPDPTLVVRPHAPFDPSVAMGSGREAPPARH